MKHVYNFAAGPATLPMPVLEEIQENIFSLNGSGLSILEVSHRAKLFESVLNEAIERTKRLLNLSNNDVVLFLQGGASTQFYMVPLNLIGEGQSADYVETGTWASKAFKEVPKAQKKARIAASSKDRDFCYIPQTFDFDPKAAYVHITSNNTIKGTAYHTFPDTKNVPLVIDMSSDMMSRPIPMENISLLYAGAQKNIGPAGTCMVIMKKSLLDRIPEDLPSMLNYRTFVENNSLYNTPPCFSIYVVSLVLKWIEETMGGLDKMIVHNQKKAAILYDFLDSTDFYRPTAQKDSRSLMNITFRLPTEDLEKQFVLEAAQASLLELKGHRSVGGCRASIYNAMPIEGVETLISFMKNFMKKNG